MKEGPAEADAVIGSSLEMAEHVDNPVWAGRREQSWEQV